MDEIFISYRRGSSEWEARCLYLALSRSFPDDAIFYDRVSMEGGYDWRERLDQALGSAAVMLVVISRNWEQLFGVASPGGPAPSAAPDAGDMSDPHSASFLRTVDDVDVHAYEIERALERKIPVIPVVIGNRADPNKATLPPNVAPIFNNNWRRVYVDSFDENVAVVHRDVDRALKRGTGPAGQPHVPGGPAEDPSPIAAAPPLAARIDHAPRPEPVALSVPAGSGALALVQVDDAMAIVEAPTSILVIRGADGVSRSSFGTTLRVQHLVVSGDGHAILVVGGGSHRVVSLDGQANMAVGTSVLPWPEEVLPLAAWRQGRNVLQVLGSHGGTLVRRRTYLNRAAQPAMGEPVPAVPVGAAGGSLVAGGAATVALVDDREVVLTAEGAIEGWPTLAGRLAGRRAVAVAGASSGGRALVAVVASSSGGTSLVGEASGSDRTVDFEVPLTATPDQVLVPPVAGGIAAPRFVAVRAGATWLAWDVEGVFG